MLSFFLHGAYSSVCLSRRLQQANRPCVQLETLQMECDTDRRARSNRHCFQQGWAKFINEINK
tara:strand:+ start:206 stop:394 length:189 start_codon:yes stop_codon:yes gene_type:complete